MAQARAASTSSTTHKLVRRGAPPPYVLGAHWLARCNSDPRAALLGWTRNELVDIRLGVRFNAVRVTNQRLGTAALGQLQQVAEVVGPVGPVIFNEALRSVEFLITYSSTSIWDMRDSEFLRDNPNVKHNPALRCPPPGREQVQGRRWLIEPDGTGLLTHPHNLAAALRAARRILHGRGRPTLAA
ncbi:hypothetical protein [Kitasatospora sp. MBT63]|uniref:hypothetical protein n=1 Tax=Kitasatospora sp. MBT63 TaxID=1444768 RepID=UPI0006920978|nr:hypothetical protein [Kitasatospora sp. MBT63]